jgi:diketogulonate reductase-like aldo/keto reductase
MPTRHIARFTHTLTTTFKMSGLSTVKLNDGLQVPVLGYGTGTALYQKEAKDSVKMAYSEAKMHHIDCAEMYQNEESVGLALKELKVKREDVFITTKCEF